MSRWQEIDRVRNAFPLGCGVYVVYWNGVVVYVGSSTSLRHRCRVYWRKHRTRYNYGETPSREKKLWRTPFGLVEQGSIRIKVKCSQRQGDWLMWEYRLIRRLQPEWNRAGIEG